MTNEQWFQLVKRAYREGYEDALEDAGVRPEQPELFTDSHLPECWKSSDIGTHVVDLMKPQNQRPIK